MKDTPNSMGDKQPSEEKMDLDDVAEKARRNLMIVSTGILAVWALGIPLDGKLVGAVDLSAVDPLRAWLAATCVLAYFTARYNFSPNTVKDWAPWSRRRRDHITSALDRSVSRAMDMGPGANNHEVVLDWIDVAQVTTQPGVNVSVQMNVNHKRKGKFAYGWYYDPPRTDTRNNDERPPLPDGPFEGTYTFRYRFYAACQWKAAREAYKPSWPLLELSFPWFLAIAAGIVCLCKIAASIYYSFPFVRQLLSA